jgi:hypothetical protein
MQTSSRVRSSVAGVVAIAVLAPLVLHAQPPKTPVGPDGAPIWTRVVRLSDGRTFVTDGAITLDAALAKPKTLPTVVLPEATGKVIEKYLAAPLENEYSYSQLSTGKYPRSYVAPSGIFLGADYVEYLARTLGKRNLRLRMKGELDPIVVLVSGKPVGLVMARKGPPRAGTRN